MWAHKLLKALKQAFQHHSSRKQRSRDESIYAFLPIESFPSSDMLRYEGHKRAGFDSLGHAFSLGLQIGIGLGLGVKSSGARVVHGAGLKLQDSVGTGPIVSDTLQGTIRAGACQVNPVRKA